MMVGVLVLPEVMVGITEASITRRLCKPMHPQPFIHHRQRIAGQPHLGRADGMEDGGADIAGGMDQIGIAVRHVGTGAEFLRLILRQRGLRASAVRVRRSASAAMRRSSSVER